MVKDNLLLQTIKLLSQRIAILEPFYNTTACLNREERELIGYLEAYMILYPEDKEFNKWLKERIIPALKAIGIAKWPRTELTDLGLRIADKDSEEEDLAKYFRIEEEDVRQ